MSQKDESTSTPLHVIADKTFAIYYLVPFEREALSKASVFRLYSQGLMRTSHLHIAAARLPADVRELTGDWPTIAAFRSSGLIEHNIIPIFLDALPRSLEAMAALPFKCVITDASTVSAVEQFFKDSPRDFLHLSTATSESKHVQQLTTDWSKFYELLTANALKSNSAAARIASEYLKAVSSDTITKPARALKHVPRLHGVTSANELAVAAWGASARTAQPLTPNEHARYADAVIASVEEVNEHRAWLQDADADIHFKARLCIAAPSMLRIYHGGKFAKNNELKKQFPSFHKAAVFFARQKSYAMETPPAQQDGEAFAAFMKDLGPYLTELKKEIDTFVASLAMMACRNLTPVLRLEPRINSVLPALSKLATIARGNHQNQRFKLNREARALMQAMLTAIDPRYLPLFTHGPEVGREGIKLVSDLPLEWVPVGGIPLMLAYETSRIPVTPGNVSIDQLYAKAQSQFLSVSSFSDILIIRSFRKDDLIREHLAAAVQVVQEKGYTSRLNIRIVDVSSVDEFIEAWNAFDGSILIFDGHGRKDDKTGLGQLVINGKPVTIWDYKDKLRWAPPIVILCACDTHAVDSHHATTANTMLMLGAKTVLGTFLPVHASYAASFITRLLLRIAQYIPIAANKDIHEPPCTWRKVVTGMQRMAYVSEVLRQLKDARNLVTDEQMSQLQEQANMNINFEVPTWNKKFVAQLSDLVAKPIEEVTRAIEESATLVDIMYYVQLGNPEDLHILTDELHASLKADAASEHQV